MNYLAIDTSGEHLLVIMKTGDKTDVFFDENCAFAHSVNLMPVVEEMAEKAGGLDKLDFFACVVGAGSFTGIRIGVSTIKALCFAFNKPALSITSFDTIAYNEVDKKVLAVIDAKHAHFYAAGYDNGKVVYPPSYIGEEELKALSGEFKLLSSNGVKNSQKVSLTEGLIKAIERKQSEITFDLDSLTPLYIRKSQAEEGR